jgi:hypothetical protein
MCMRPASPRRLYRRSALIESPFAPVKDKLGSRAVRVPKRRRKISRLSFRVHRSPRLRFTTQLRQAFQRQLELVRPPASELRAWKTILRAFREGSQS